MRVLKIIHTLGHGGAENAFRWLAWGLKRKGVDVVAAIPRVNHPHEENWLAAALSAQDIPFITFDKSGSPRQFLKSISAVIDQVSPDVVHSHLLDSNAYSALACWRNSIPHVCTEHGDVSLKKTTVSRIKYGIISLCSRCIICVSEAVRTCASRVIQDKGKLKTIYNGIHAFEKNCSSFRREFDIPAAAVLIGTVGNLYPVKGHTYLIRAFAELCFSNPLTYLVLVGRGVEEDALRQQVAELKIPSDRVIFTGFRNDIENVMNAFDLYVQPSLSEGHPIAVLEAMSLGIPVIATSVGGIPEIIGQNRYGTMVNPQSWEDIYARIQEYLDHPDTFKEKARAAQSHTCDVYSIDKMAVNYIEAYQQALVS